jgi:hypothetical protein
LSGISAAGAEPQTASKALLARRSLFMIGHEAIQGRGRLSAPIQVGGDLSATAAADPLSAPAGKNPLRHLDGKQVIRLKSAS